MALDQRPKDKLLDWFSGLDAAWIKVLAAHAYIRVTLMLAVLAAPLLLLWLVGAAHEDGSRRGYMTLHVFLATCSVVVLLLVFVLSRGAKGTRVNRNLAFIGVTALAIAAFQFLNVQSLLGAPFLGIEADPAAAATLWLTARLLSAAALLFIACGSWTADVARRDFDQCTWIMVGAVVAVAALTMVWPGWLPATNLAGGGPTRLKMAVEVAAIGCLLFASVSFFRLAAQPVSSEPRAHRYDPIALLAAALVSLLGEMLSAISSDVDSLYGELGHFYGVVGVWFLYRGLLATDVFDAETRARLALEAARMGAWVWDIGSDVVSWDRAAAANWGLPPSSPATMTAIDARVHPDDLAGKQEAMRRALDPAGDGSYAADYRVVDPVSGRLRHIASRGKTEFHKGRPVRVVGVVRDVTGSWQADHAVRTSEARLSGIFSIAADAIISIDESQAIVLFNQGAEAIFGWTRDEVLGKPLHILLPERYRAAHGSHITHFSASGSAARRMGERSQIAGLRKDGTEFPAEASISKLASPEGMTFTVVLRDVTDRKRFEQQLERRVAERTAELSALLDAVPDGIVQIEPDQKIRAGNAAMTRLFGYEPPELAGRTSSTLFASASDTGAVAAAWALWETGKAFEPVSVECRRKDASTFTAMVLGNVVRDRDGRIMSRVGIIRDVTEELKRQKALSQSQRMEAIGQLTGGIAHDFNNLLTVISGNQELLEMRLSDEKDIALLKRAQAAADMGARLTARLLTVARRRQLTPAIISLNEQITSMVDLLRRSIGEHVTLTTNLAPRLPLVKADPSEIENAVLNLAINARDAMPSGGTIVIETDEQVVDMGGLVSEGKLKPGRYVRLSVTDTGVGMTPEVASRVFEPFYTTKQPGKGTGLGLSTIHGFAQQSGGAVTLYSEPGRGTTVNIYLPSFASDGLPLATAETDETVPISAGERVLLVEDNPEVREVARKRLEDLGYVVDEVASGPEALARMSARGARFDIVFSDVVMPGGMSGYDVARWVAQNARGMKVLLTSGYPGEVASQREDAINIPLLRKPYSRIELARAIRRALDA